MKSRLARHALGAMLGAALTACSSAAVPTRGVATDNGGFESRAFGSVFVSVQPSGRGRIDIYSQGAEHKLIGQIDMGSFSQPAGLATDSSGNLYVADSQQREPSVDVYHNGTTTPFEVLPLPQKGSYGYPNFVAVDANGDVAAITHEWAVIYPPGKTAPCAATQLGGSLANLGPGAFDKSGNLFITLQGVSGTIAEVTGGCNAASMNLQPRGVVYPMDLKFEAGNMDILDALPSSSPVIDIFKPSRKQPSQLVPINAGRAFSPTAFAFTAANSVWVLEHCPGNTSGCYTDEAIQFPFPQGGKPMSRILITNSGAQLTAYGIATSNQHW